MNQNYSETIKTHYHHPLNVGKLTNPTYTAEQLNPLCGDEIKIYLSAQGGSASGGKITDVRYEARGCMISIAAASVLSKYIKGKSLSAIKKIAKKDMDKLLGVTISRARESCSTLALNAIQKALNLPPLSPPSFRKGGEKEGVRF